MTKHIAKFIIAGITAVALVLVFMPKNQEPDEENNQVLSAHAERQLKQQMLEKDVQQSERLCRSQCRLDLSVVLEQATARGGMNSDSLRQLQKEHPHMKYLESRMGSADLASQGNLKDLPAEINPYIEFARDSVNNGRQYESPPITAKEGTYFVLALPSDNGYVLGAIHQKLLKEIRTHQRKNLRLVPYPHDARYGIETIDSDTLRTKDVDTAEENENSSHYHQNEVVVKFKTPPAQALLTKIKKEIKADRMEKLGYTYVFHSKTMSTKQLIAYFNKRHETEYVEHHFLYVTNSFPNDALYSEYQWNLPIIETEPGWEIAAEGEQIIVGVVDTGVDLTHPDLKKNLMKGFNVYTEKSDANDDVGHGTHVAGIIAAEINNLEGIAGISPNSKVLPVKVLDETGAGSTYAVAQGIIWAADHGAKVINMSLGNYAEAQFLHDAIRYAYDKDVVLIAATGNDNTEDPGYPAAYPEVLAVGAIDENRDRAVFSNYGTYVDVVAPGVNIASTYMDNQYAALSGTSMASPHVAAVAAMIRSVNPLLKNKEVMEILRSTSIDIGKSGHDKYFGYGQIDINNALHAAASSGSSIMNWGEWIRRQIDMISAKLNKGKAGSLP